MKKIDTMDMRSIEAGWGIDKTKFSIETWTYGADDNDGISFFGLKFIFNNFGKFIVGFKQVANYIMFDSLGFKSFKGTDTGLDFFFSIDNFFKNAWK